jgi:hypothetical protein
LEREMVDQKFSSHGPESGRLSLAAMSF